MEECWSLLSQGQVQVLGWPVEEKAAVKRPRSKGESSFKRDIRQYSGQFFFIQIQAINQTYEWQVQCQHISGSRLSSSLPVSDKLKLLWFLGGIENCKHLDSSNGDINELANSCRCLINDSLKGQSYAENIHLTQTHTLNTLSQQRYWNAAVVEAPCSICSCIVLLHGILQRGYEEGCLLLNFQRPSLHAV